MKFVMSYSGGKDSALALYRMLEEGHIPAALLTTVNRERERSWFHGLPEALQEAERIGYPVMLKARSGGGGRGIRVIRLGLHDQPSLEQDFVAGPYHPAFRELCEGRIYLKQALRQIAVFPPGQALYLFVNPKAVSKMAGQHRCNLGQLQQRNPIKIKPDDTLPLFDVRVERQFG